MATFDAEIEVDVICDTCGATLETNVAAGRYGSVLYVEPCRSCLSDQYVAGHEDGYEEACANADLV